ncbi:Flavin-dependent oxidoreductase, luciferase family (includes alkanesulfonate monooxygenase SsuD and methylene tetrahydromethanopterin reductase) [Jatrophihabitans endophyticus]|uniref:Flavin-dependent oxidoreductase, luciferase family (Includes alkanesulfonate monooxygenase SsuD and methylene tetrahydromethanopterin reductase) n=1 Tax=Jatrophihabitans endophyticus TaxID=1206085 RepID=A0A1M5DNI4_9ACTN|nr:LLM class flavin-dependent oxidoreductase [Jatrophihabitans endophyticus]SHF68547.1 Flavin-dependent oxidoreductase, luciferase family (includes alkanesulfonate monooxygenase SsuD and methylene tetrahydromethanopterin reductase) [Jatrophihabitans endophyticus]
MTGRDPRPFRFGVTASRTGDLAEWTRTARRVESLGYARLLLPDVAAGPAPLPALAAAAAATESLRVGSWVLCEPLRPRGLLAWDVRTLHELLGERFELGLGAGRPGAERDAALLGVDYDDPAGRVARLTVTLRRLRDELPGLRLLVAASGTRMLRLAGRQADTVALGWHPDTDLESAARLVAVVARAARDRDDPPALAAGLLAVGDVGTPWSARLGTTPAALAAHGAVTVVTGTAREMADSLRRRRDALGVAHWTIPAEAVDAFAPVVDLLRGS